MFKGERGFFGLVVICLLVAGVIWTALRPSFPQLPNSAHKRADEGKYSPGSPACYPSRLNGLPRREALDERYRCEVEADKHRLQSDDLVQQTRSADAAVAAVDLTYRQMLIELAGGIVGLLTLLAAAYAAWYARRAAAAGHVSNKIAREGNRAWVSLEANEKAQLWISKDSIKLATDVICQNHGSSPALNVWCSGFITFRRPTTDEILGYITASEADEKSGATILFADSPAEGTGVEIEYAGDIPDTAMIFVTFFVKYRIAAENDWSCTALPYVTKLSGSTAPDSSVGDNIRLKTDVSAERFVLTLHKGRGGLPVAT